MVAGFGQHAVLNGDWNFIMSLEGTHTFYICYFGLREPLVQTQVIAYLETLVAAGMRVSLLTFEANLDSSWTAEEMAQWRAKMDGKNIEWHFLKYHKRPTVPATVYDILRGFWYIRRRVKSEKIAVMHARSNVSAVIGSLVKFFSFSHKPKLIFDIRGFITEEYVDAGLWKRGGFLHRLSKKIEPWLLRQSDGFVVLTRKAREILFPRSTRQDPTDDLGRPVEVIPSCVDIDRFDKLITPTSREEIRRELNIGDRETFIYVGSFGGWYLTEELIDFLAAARKRNPSIFVIFLTHHNAVPLAEILRAKGFTDADFIIRKVSPDQVPPYLAASDVGLSFVKPCYSKLSSSPTKIAEYLVAGLPIISTSGIGDVDEHLLDNKVGLIASELSEPAYEKVLDDLKVLQNDKDLAARCRQTANENFNLKIVGKANYQKLYRRVLQPRPLRTLYLCYFGVREPLVQTQVIPYLQQIAKAGIKVNLLTFEPRGEEVWTPENEERQARILSESGINWTWENYHKSKSLSASSKDVIVGIWTTLKLVWQRKINVIHARAHVPVLIGMLVSGITGCRLIFDIRGLMAEEYADSNIWSNKSLPFRAVKFVERIALLKADQVVVLTNRMRNYLIDNGLRKADTVEVIPCCMDFSRLETPPVADNLEPKKRFELIYAGSISGLYLLKEMGEFFLELQKLRPNAFFRILTITPPEYVQDIFDTINISRDSYAVERVSPSVVPQYLKKADLGISFRTATFSQIAASPTKVPEYLSCGLPVVHNVGIGDTNEILDKEQVGVNVDNFERETLADAAKLSVALLDQENISERCVAVANKYFNLTTIGRNGYLNVYRKLGFQDRQSLIEAPEEAISGAAETDDLTALVNTPQTNV